MENIYKFSWDCGRMGSVTSVFIADEKKIEEAIGESIYFGEILGKHSEVYGSLDNNDLEIMSNNIEAIKILRDIFKGDSISGYNPLNYIRCQECGDQKDGKECKYCDKAEE